MSKTISKMNKKELIEKIKQLEKDTAILLHKESRLCAFIYTANLFDVFLEMVNEEEETGRLWVSYKKIKEKVREIECDCDCDCECDCKNNVAD